VKVVKNKVAPPFREAAVHILYGEGVSLEGEILELGVSCGVVDKSGACTSTKRTASARARTTPATSSRKTPSSPPRSRRRSARSSASRARRCWLPLSPRCEEAAHASRAGPAAARAREHSRAELGRKLSAHARPEDDLESLLEDLSRRRLLSDERYAESRAHARRASTARRASRTSCARKPRQRTRRADSQGRARDRGGSARARSGAGNSGSRPGPARSGPGRCAFFSHEGFHSTRSARSSRPGED